MFIKVRGLRHDGVVVGALRHEVLIVGGRVLPQPRIVKRLENRAGQRIRTALVKEKAVLPRQNPFTDRLNISRNGNAPQAIASSKVLGVPSWSPGIR